MQDLVYAPQDKRTLFPLNSMKRQKKNLYHDQSRDAACLPSKPATFLSPIASESLYPSILCTRFASKEGDLPPTFSEDNVSRESGSQGFFEPNPKATGAHRLELSPPTYEYSFPYQDSSTLLDGATGFLASAKSEKRKYAPVNLSGCIIRTEIGAIGGGSFADIHKGLLTVDTQEASYVSWACNMRKLRKI